MATFLLDTNILIDVINGRNNRPSQIEALLDGGALLACTSINVTEIYMGMRPEESEATERLLKELDFYPVTWDIAQLAGQLFNQWRHKGQTPALADATIAAVCIANSLTLVTDNRRHFPMPELEIHLLGQAE